QEGLRLTAAHIHHGLREASDQEAVTVRDYCATLAVPCAYGELDVRAHQERTGQGTQLAARELRYDFLHATAARIDA
ncbi:ATP-binding protein, partial [Paenibacillus sp. 598K]|uniref:ATP-binding protein n=1 Tax=Paenibacillus sp. 598K TaxID=1117987 RepID=UPI002738A89B